MVTNAPWLKHYGNVPHTLDYPDCSMVTLLETRTAHLADSVACEFMGSRLTFGRLMSEIDKCARALAVLGVVSGDRVTLCLPNVPQALIMFYAINRIGAVANMIHPLSSEGEIEFFLKTANSKIAITLDRFSKKFAEMPQKTPLETLIVTSIGDGLDTMKKIAYAATQIGKSKAIKGDNIYSYHSFMSLSEQCTHNPRVETDGQHPAVIMYSGGSTGTPKGVLLTNLNFNALGLQTAAMGECVHTGSVVLAILPIFHGFGLGVSIHTMLLQGANCMLIPQFDLKGFVTILKKHRPNIITAVPTLYDALLRVEHQDDLELSCLEGVFCGGDRLSPALKQRFDAFLIKHNAHVPIREGFGMTECVAASCLTPKHMSKIGSIGIPFPDMFYKIVAPGTVDELPFDSDGEICISGPSVMKEYVGNPEETAQTLKRHEDGRIWLHTGDLGSMDSDGFVFFKQRLKRIIISSGYNIYPSQLESVLDAHPAVLMSAVIGVDDEYKIQKAKAFVVLKPEAQNSAELRADIKEHCKKFIAKYAMPYEFEYRDSLPKTAVGKVAYTQLEQEQKDKI